MHIDVVLAVVGALGVVVAAISSTMRRLPLSEPLLGLLAGVLLGPQLLDALPIAPVTVEHGLFHELARILLAVSVMAVALRYPIAAVRRHRRALAVLLLIVMPAMAAISAGLGWAMAGLPLAAALLFGTAICPTDPVLASSVVTGDLAERDLPARDRQLLSLESAANDGLALPLVVAAIAVAGPLSAGAAVTESLWQVLGALVAGALLGVDDAVLGAGTLVLTASTVAFGLTGAAGRKLYIRAGAGQGDRVQPTPDRDRR
ncbi:hypothetical protein HBA53_14975 [Rhodococcus pyridinivorans]|uniref:cation:proton antiporter domain-containing protein n=1 Tax=Rhodococcus pyridinivorans TaxID=103816 RepID=UPI001C30D8EE|nr:cation:proton antiporter [Rhodococcus pyridinivorans]QXF82185.1 hypothetical protein HBA53_14975 [Rhodococcus pyridinivorans]